MGMGMEAIIVMHMAKIRGMIMNMNIFNYKGKGTGIGIMVVDVNHLHKRIVASG